MIKWSKEEDERIFEICKKYGTNWAVMAKEFPGRTENQVKNRFYSTLRRVATKKISKDHLPYKSSIQMGKQELLQYIDEAIQYGRDCYSQRGRKRKIRAQKDTLESEKVEAKREVKEKVKELPSIAMILETAKRSINGEQKAPDKPIRLPWLINDSQPFVLRQFMNCHPLIQPSIPPFLFIGQTVPASYQMDSRRGLCDRLIGKQARIVEQTRRESWLRTKEYLYQQ